MSRVKLKPLFKSLEQSRLRYLTLKFVKNNSRTGLSKIKIYNITRKKNCQTSKYDIIDEELLTTFRCNNENIKSIEEKFLNKILEKIRNEK